MPYKIVDHRVEAHRAQSVEELRRAFEKAVFELHQADLTAKKRQEYSSPIVPRRRILGISRASAEKRALSDAARALATLWKV
jgi:uncharacterized Ntn-hydrolase superfamily protein